MRNTQVRMHGVGSCQLTSDQETSVFGARFLYLSFSSFLKPGLLVELTPSSSEGIMLYTGKSQIAKRYFPVSSISVLEVGLLEASEAVTSLNSPLFS